MPCSPETSPVFMPLGSCGCCAYLPMMPMPRLNLSSTLGSNVTNSGRPFPSPQTVKGSHGPLSKHLWYDHDTPDVPALLPLWAAHVGKTGIGSPLTILASGVAHCLLAQSPMLSEWMSKCMNEWQLSHQTCNFLTQLTWECPQFSLQAFFSSRSQIFSILEAQN